MLGSVYPSQEVPMHPLLETVLVRILFGLMIALAIWGAVDFFRAMKEDSPYESEESNVHPRSNFSGKCED